MAEYTLVITPAFGGSGYTFQPLTPKVHWSVSFERSGETDKVTAILETWEVEAMFFGEVGDVWADWEAFTAAVESLDPFHIQLKYGGSVKRELKYLSAGDSSLPSCGRGVHSIRVTKYALLESEAGKANNLKVSLTIVGKQYVWPKGDDKEPPEWIRRSHTKRRTSAGIQETWRIWVKCEDGLKYCEDFKEEYRNGRVLDSAEITHNIDEGTWSASFSVLDPEGEAYKWEERITTQGGGSPISFMPMSDSELPSTVIGPKQGCVVQVAVTASAGTEEVLKAAFSKHYRSPSWIEGSGGWDSEKGDVLPGQKLCFPVGKKEGRKGRIKKWQIQYTQSWKFDHLEASLFTGAGIFAPISREEPKEVEHEG